MSYDSFNKKSNNAQGGQSRVSSASVNLDSNSAAAARTVQNGAHSQPLQGTCSFFPPFFSKWLIRESCYLLSVLEVFEYFEFRVCEKCYIFLC